MARFATSSFIVATLFVSGPPFVPTGDVHAVQSARWDPEEAFWNLEMPSPWEVQVEQEHRFLNTLTDRAREVKRHRDIITKKNGGSPRVFDDSGSCGIDDDQAPCCNQTCSNLQYCQSLNGRRIEDKYFPTLPFIQGSCLNFDERAARLDIWGDYHTNKPFRDTAECRQLVLDYTCLWWATMFTDRCYNETAAPRRPCRSFCVDVALTCANDPFDWVNLCHNIECPVKAGKCSTNGTTINPKDEGTYEYGSKDCWVVKDLSAYSAASHLSALSTTSTLLSVAVAAVLALA